MTDTPKASSGKAPAAQRKRDRLADALRANLKRRKEQARARRANEAGEPETPATPDKEAGGPDSPGNSGI